MKLYADLPARRTLQMLADITVFAWVALWAWLGRTVHDATMRLAEPGRTLQGAGSGFRDQMGQAGRSVSDVPLVGDQLAEPFERAGGAGTSIEQAGSDLVDAVTSLALLLGWVTALVPIGLVVFVWAVLRGRFVRRATAAQQFIDSAADLDLFALRAMATQPMHRLAGISDDPTGGWRARDPRVIAALAQLELRNCGLRPPGVSPRVARSGA